MGGWQALSQRNMGPMASSRCHQLRHCCRKGEKLEEINQNLTKQTLGTNNKAKVALNHLKT